MVKRTRTPPHAIGKHPDPDRSHGVTTQQTPASKAGTAPATYYRAETESLRQKNNIGRLLKQSYASLNRMIDENVMPLGLTAMQWKPLVIICHQNINTPAEVARKAMVDTGAMTRTLDRLEAKGFLVRKRCETDRRVVNLELTEAGREVVNGILPAVANAFNAHLAGFTDQEIETLFNLLGRLIVNGSGKAEPDTLHDC